MKEFYLPKSNFSTYRARIVRAFKNLGLMTYVMEDREKSSITVFSEKAMPGRSPSHPSVPLFRFEIHYAIYGGIPKIPHITFDSVYAIGNDRRQDLLDLAHFLLEICESQDKEVARWSGKLIPSNSVSGNFQNKIIQEAGERLRKWREK